ncbi:MAG: prepilin peptidase [Candidatus Saccharimonadales bacterium]
MIIVVLAVFGLIFGSFVNALVWRLRQQELAGKKSKKQYSILTGRSMCPECHHELAAKDLVPVLSWLSLKGKCRYCREPISGQYPLVELATAIMFVFSYIYWPLDLHGAGLVQLVFWLFFVVAFMALAVYDLKWFLLPDRLVYPLVAMASTEVIVVAFLRQSWTFAASSVLGALVLSGTFYVLFQISKGNWIGGGDVKLGLVLGLLAGSSFRAVIVIFLASLFGTAVSLPLLVKSKKNIQTRVPFGPFLLLATVVVVLFGSSLVSWYDKLLLK